jgi:hypothetical protein
MLPYKTKVNKYFSQYSILRRSSQRPIFIHSKKFKMNRRLERARVDAE